MSASLVGSEMCIRDRSSPCRPRRANPTKPPTPCGGCGMGFPTWTGNGAVSYTHLRCRRYA
eukprot:1887148-Alexandrium_andersonii.AAC.1